MIKNENPVSCVNRERKNNKIRLNTKMNIASACGSLLKNGGK